MGLVYMPKDRYKWDLESLLYTVNLNSKYHPQNTLFLFLWCCLGRNPSIEFIQLTLDFNSRVRLRRVLSNDPTHRPGSSSLYYLEWRLTYYHNEISLMIHFTSAWLITAHCLGNFLFVSSLFLIKVNDVSPRSAACFTHQKETADCLCSDR